MASQGLVLKPDIDEPARRKSRVSGSCISAAPSRKLRLRVRVSCTLSSTARAVSECPRA